MSWDYIKNVGGYEHRRIAEAALGKPLPLGVEVHHVNHSRDNSALVICPGRAYHMLLHYRQRALEASGNANYVKCEHCKKFDDPENNMWVHPRITRAYHRTCHAEAAARKKAA